MLTRKVQLFMQAFPYKVYLPTSKEGRKLGRLCKKFCVEGEELALGRREKAQLKTAKMWI